MWWPLRAPAPLVAEKGTQVRILGRTRCCIFPITCRLPNSLITLNFRSLPFFWWEGPKASDGNEPEDLPRYR